jgi:hypothetical protein
MAMNCRHMGNERENAKGEKGEGTAGPVEGVRVGNNREYPVYKMMGIVGAFSFRGGVLQINKLPEAGNVAGQREGDSSGAGVVLEGILCVPGKNALRPAR